MKKVNGEELNAPQSEVIIPNVKFLNALRNSGYNNYAAIADIVDNSLEEDVNSKNIRILLPPKNESFDFIKICDDGTGMDLETLKESIRLGSSSEKEADKDLGFYGTGLKSAALSIGRKLTIYTKSPNDEFYYAVFDYDRIRQANDWVIEWGKGTEEQYDEFQKLTLSETGTIIEISNLDRLSVETAARFFDTLYNRLSIIFRYFIEEKGINIFINNKKIIGTDPLRRNKDYSIRISKLNETFDFRDKKYTFNVHYLRKDRKNIIDSEGYDKRNEYWSGIYIYRNWRLVGEAVGLGIHQKSGDGYGYGVRCELFIDGEDDPLFGSTFTKMISEKDKNDIDQSFKDTVRSALIPYINECRNRDKKQQDSEKQILNEETQKNFEDIDKGINSKSKILGIERGKGQNQKRPEDLESSKKRGPQENPNPHKKRNEIWMKTNFSPLGEHGKIFDISIENGLHNVIINTDHIFWKEFLSIANQGTQEMFIKWFSSSSAALDKVDVEFNEKDDKELLKRAFLDEYYEELSKFMRKMIQY